MRRNRFYLNDAEELSEMTADDPEAASSIDAPEENDVDAESGGADYPSVGSPLPGTLPEQGSSETEDVQVEDFFDKKRSKKRRRGMFDYYDGDDEDKGDDDSDDSDDSEDEESGDDEEPKDYYDKRRSKKRRRGCGDTLDDLEDRRRKKKGKRGLLNWNQWVDEDTESPVTPDDSETEEPDPGTDVDPNGDPDLPSNLTTPVIQQEETSPDDQVTQKSEELIDRLFRRSF